MEGARGRKELGSIFVQDVGALLRAQYRDQCLLQSSGSCGSAVTAAPHSAGTCNGYERIVKFTSAGLSERLLKEAVLIKIFKGIIRLLCFFVFLEQDWCVNTF